MRGRILWLTVDVDDFFFHLFFNDNNNTHKKKIVLVFGFFLLFCRGGIERVLWKVACRVSVTG